MKRTETIQHNRDIPKTYGDTFKISDYLFLGRPEKPLVASGIREILQKLPFDPLRLSQWQTGTQQTIITRSKPEIAPSGLKSSIFYHFLHFLLIIHYLNII